MNIIFPLTNEFGKPLSNRIENTEAILESLGVVLKKNIATQKHEIIWHNNNWKDLFTAVMMTAEKNKYKLSISRYKIHIDFICGQNAYTPQ